MNCDRNKLNAYLDGELSQGEITSVEKHLAQCNDCRSELEALKQLDRLLDMAEPVNAPADFDVKLAERLKTPVVPIARLRTLGKVITAIAASFVLVAGWIIYVNSTSTAVDRGGSVAMRNADAPVASSLSALAHIEVIENLELLENLQVAIALNALPEMDSLQNN